MIEKRLVISSDQSNILRHAHASAIEVSQHRQDMLGMGNQQCRETRRPAQVRVQLVTNPLQSSVVMDHPSIRARHLGIAHRFEKADLAFFVAGQF